MQNASMIAAAIFGRAAANELPTRKPRRRGPAMMREVKRRGFGYSGLWVVAKHE